MEASRETRSALEMAVSRFRNRTLSGAWGRYRDFIGDVRAARAAVAVFANRAARASWNRWCDFVVEREDARECAGRAVAFFIRAESAKVGWCRLSLV